LTAKLTGKHGSTLVEEKNPYCGLLQ